MSRRFEKEVGAAVVLLCVVVLGLGLALLGRAYTMPTHVDERKAHELTEIYEQGYYDMSPQEREQHANEIVGMRTAKWPLYNTGVCLCLVAATLAVPIVRFRLWDIRNLKTATTPATRLRLIALASAAWLELIPAFFLDLQDGYAEDDLRPHDNVGNGLFLGLGIPIMIMIWIFSVLMCRFVVLRNVNLPAALWYKDDKRTYRTVGLRMFYGAMIGLLAVFFVLSVVYFKWGIPSGLIGIYVMLSSRAALLSRNQQGAQQGLR